MNTKDKKKFDYTNLKLTDGYKYNSEDEEQQQTSKNFNKLNENIIKEVEDMDKEIFKIIFNFKKPSVMLKYFYNLNDREKNKKLVNVIESGLSDFKNEIEKMTEKQEEIVKPHEIVDIVENTLMN